MPVSKQTFINLTTKFLTDTFVEFVQPFDIIQNLRTPDGQGGFSIVRDVFASTEGFIFAKGGAEPLKAGGKYLDKTYKFSLKPISGIKEDMLIRYDNKDYKIISVENLVEGDIWLNIITEVDE